jgi:hypothetical protein
MPRVETYFLTIFHRYLPKLDEILFLLFGARLYSGGSFDAVNKKPLWRPVASLGGHQEAIEVSKRRALQSFRLTGDQVRGPCCIGGLRPISMAVWFLLKFHFRTILDEP